MRPSLLWASALLLALSLLISADTVRETVKTEIRTVMGLDPVLSGDVSVSLFPTGSVRFYDVSLGDKRAGTSALTTEQLVVRLRFFPFLIGRIEIADVTLVRPTITIGFASGGSSNWAAHVDALARALVPSPDRARSFSEIRIRDGTVMLHDENYKAVETLTNVDFALAWPSISRSFAATGRFVWHDEPIDATLSFTDFAAALAGDRSGLKLRVTGAPLKFAFDGNMSHRPSLKMEGTLAADTASLRDTLRWAAYWTSPGGGFGPFSLKAQASIVGGTISLSGVNVELDGNTGEGVLTFASDGRQTLQGTLAAETLDLTPYISTFRLLSDNEWNRRPIELSDLNSIDADLRLSAARVTLAHLKLGRTAIAANLRGGNLNVGIGESQAFGGMVNGSFGLAHSSTGVTLKTQLQFADVELDQCLGELIGVRRIEGKGTLAFILDSAGASVYELAQGLNGMANLSTKKGAITGVNIEQLLKRLERNPIAGRGDFRSGKTPFDMLTVSLKVTQGIATVEDLKVESPTVRLGLTGTASVPARDLDLRGSASLVAGTARDATGFELPFVVTGPWDDPLIWPDPSQSLRRRETRCSTRFAATSSASRRGRPEVCRTAQRTPPRPCPHRHPSKAR